MNIKECKAGEIYFLKNNGGHGAIANVWIKILDTKDAPIYHSGCDCDDAIPAIVLEERNMYTTLEKGEIIGISSEAHIMDKEESDLLILQS